MVVTIMQTKLSIHGQGPIKSNKVALSAKLGWQLQLAILNLASNYQQFLPQSVDSYRMKKHIGSNHQKSSKHKFWHACMFAHLTKHVKLKGFWKVRILQK